MGLFGKSKEQKIAEFKKKTIHAEWQGAQKTSEDVQGKSGRDRKAYR